MRTFRKNPKAQFRAFRKKLRLKQEDLASLAGVSPETVAKFERGKHVSQDTSQGICIAVFKANAQRNPEAMKKAAQPALEAAERCDRVLSLEPGSQSALD
jgi:transcriptional regulator with XRE-family HTH domain